MALRSTNRRTISMAADVSNTLPITAVKQEQTNWGWDACMQMVFQYHHLVLAQCEISQQVSWQTYKKCCSKKSCCNQAVTSAQVSKGWSDFEYTYTYKSSASTYAEIQTSINASQVVEAWLEWTGGGAQTVIIVGYNTSGGNFIHVNDPTEADTLVMTYGFLKVGYGKGKWQLSWNNIS